MTPSEERMVIEKVRGGDTDAFEALVLNNQKRVYNLALKLTGNEDDALDISQEAFLRAYTGLKSFRGESRFSVWLYRLVYNLCIDDSRKKQRTQASSLTYIDEEGAFSELEIPDIRYEPSDEAEKRELRQAVSAGVDALPIKFREVLVMRELTGMSYEDISRTLGIGVGTVKSRLSRARQRLALILVRNGTFLNDNRRKDIKEVERHG